MARPRTTRALRYVDPGAERGRLYRALARFSATPIGGWLSVRLSWRLDPPLLALSGGRVSSAWPLVTALLETRGAKSGLPRRTATLYFHDRGSVIVVASLRGWPRHPAWYHNLRAHPEVRFGGLPFTAETVTDADECDRLWGLADRVYPPYAEYRRLAATSNRRIPIVRLVPAG
jgi:deazaflavin-dependent oxidoreductase (nitroreductase family)